MTTQELIFSNLTMLEVLHDSFIMRFLCDLPEGQSNLHLLFDIVAKVFVDSSVILNKTDSI